MSISLKHIPHYTYEDYLQWEGRWELIQGFPYAMTPSPSFDHQDVNTKIIGQLYVKLAQCMHCRPMIFIDWKITEDTVVQPDVSVICKPNFGKFLNVTPSLIFEILSPATAQKDRFVKYELYQLAGVKYYVLIDIIKKTAEVFELKEGEYELVSKLSTENFLFDLDTCKVDFEFSTIW
jgi:Uma2 family endonuclease